MTIDDYLDSEDFLLFLDETLRQQACQAVDFFLERNEPAAKTQLYSIPAMIQAKGLEGLNKLTEYQKEKAEQKKIRKANRNLTTKVMERALPVYFEHFNCHYFYKSR